MEMHASVHESLPEDFVSALKEVGVWDAFQQFSADTARDLGDWIASAEDVHHRGERTKMAVELVAHHFAPLIEKGR